MCLLPRQHTLTLSAALPMRKCFAEHSLAWGFFRKENPPTNHTPLLKSRSSCLHFLKLFWARGGGKEKRVFFSPRQHTLTLSAALPMRKCFAEHSLA